MPQSCSYDGLTPNVLRARATMKWNTHAPDVLPLWLAEMDFPTAPVVHAAIRDAVDREEFGYPRNDAATGLPEAVAEWSARRYDWQVDPQRVHVLADVVKGVEVAVEEFSSPGSPVVLPTPAYTPFFEVLKVLGRPIVEVPMVLDAGRHVLDLDGIDRAFDSGAEMLLLCQPHNPLGRLFSRAELSALSEVVARHEACVTSDEIHAPLAYEAAHVPYASVSAEAAGHTITLVSPSKAWNLPGLKCAQAITSNDAHEERWRRISRVKTHGASTLGITANLAAYRSGAAWLDATLAHLDHNRRLLAELLHEWLPEVTYTLPEATYFAWLDFGRLGLPGEPADFFLANARVALSAGQAFGADGAGCARLNFATTTPILEQAVEAMTAALRNHQRATLRVPAPASVALTTVVAMNDAEDVRRIALSLPDTVEKEAWSMPTFRVGGKMYLTIPDDQTSFAVRCPKSERTELIAAEPEKFWVPPHEASSAWVRVRLTALEDLDELRDIVVDSWRQAAPDRLAEQFPHLRPGTVPGE